MSTAAVCLVLWPDFDICVYGLRSISETTNNPTTFILFFLGEWEADCVPRVLGEQCEWKYQVLYGGTGEWVGL